MRAALTSPVLAAALLLGGCAKDGAGPGPGPAPTSATSATSAGPTGSPAPTSSPTPAPSPASAAAVNADELGRVPVLMYHQLIERPGRDDVTPRQFRAELQRLYDEGYRPVTAADFVAGRIEIPAGTHPVVLTLDDSTVSQARIGPDGEPRPDTALGILEAFGRAHPDFRPTATFFVNTVPEPFVDGKVLPWLAAHGYEIGAHTRSHAFLRSLSDAEVQKEIGLNIAEIEAAVPGYRVRTFATTGGIWPRNAALVRLGAHDGRPYALEGVFGVDEISSRSPFHAEFNPYRVPRAGAGDVAPVLDALARNPSGRYTSDGDPATVAFPADRAGDLAPAWRDRALPY